MGGCAATAPAPSHSPDQPSETAELPVLRGVSGPRAIDPDSLYVEQRLNAMTLEQKLGSLVMIHVPGIDPVAIRAAVERDQLGGVILMGDNLPGDAIATATLTGALHADPGLPLLTAIDQEGGVVRRLPGDEFPAGQVLHDDDPARVVDAFASRSALVAQAGVLINFGIVADVPLAPGSFIGPRTIGATPEVAAEHVAAAVHGESPNVLSTLKHFPGHGASPDDSHSSIPTSSVTLAEWRRTHALPFVAGVAAGAPLVMTGHLRFESVSPLPASLSPTWITILRHDLGFSGIIITDDLLMLQRSGEAEFADPIENGVRALDAGNDLLLYVVPGDPSSVGFAADRLIAALAAAVVSGRLAEADIDDSVRRVLSVRRAASGQSGPWLDCGPKCRGESPRSRSSATDY
jgi:beta-N-acetylhexosaminidase